MAKRKPSVPLKVKSTIPMDMGDGTPLMVDIPIDSKIKVRMGDHEIGTLTSIRFNLHKGLDVYCNITDIRVAEMISNPPTRLSMGCQVEGFTTSNMIINWDTRDVPNPIEPNTVTVKSKGEVVGHIKSWLTEEQVKKITHIMGELPPLVLDIDKS